MVPSFFSALARMAALPAGVLMSIAEIVMPAFVA